MAKKKGWATHSGPLRPRLQPRRPTTWQTQPRQPTEWQAHQQMLLRNVAAREPGWNKLSAQTEVKKKRSLLRKEIMEHLRASKRKLEDPSVEGDAEKQLIDIITSLELQLEDLGGGSDEEADWNASLDLDASPHDEHSDSEKEGSRHEESHDVIAQAAEADGAVPRLSPPEKLWPSKRKHDNIMLESEEAKEQRLQKEAADFAKQQLRRKTANLKQDVENQIALLSERLKDPSCDGVKRQQMEQLLGTLHERLEQLGTSQPVKDKKTRRRERKAERDNQLSRASTASLASAHTSPAVAHNSHPESSPTNPAHSAHQHELFRSPPCEVVRTVSRPRPSCAPGLAPL
eukprot:TRINITY_DN61312_c0_g1_i1.p1 TRINITY_DN61312_c0_g1~~TRINITY_DN61312_c0_g1_i1.p1  ORF type:complete len:345 (-),score=72.36 TRINITY_DN61312_c0_g1_i1:228-1262(-)